MDADWDVFLRDRCPCHRERLILRYMPVADRAAAAVRRRLPQADPDDVRSWSYIGLMRAVDRWDPSYGSTFDSYAMGAIRGVSIDEARSIDWAPRSVRRRQREVDRATVELEVRLGRPPSSEEVAAMLGWGAGELGEASRDTEVAFVKSLDEGRHISPDGEVVSRYEMVEDQEAVPEVRAAASEMARRMVEFLREVSPEARLLMALYYFEGFRLADAGAVLGVSESRAGAIHSETLVGLMEAVA